jgi:hypothetical protein
MWSNSAAAAKGYRLRGEKSGGRHASALDAALAQGTARGIRSATFLVER